MLSWQQYDKNLLALALSHFLWIVSNQVSGQGLHCLLRECLIHIWKTKEIPPDTHKIRTGSVLLIRVGKS